jgi:endonuclease/exonuclease/phosphatase family metal-dependent hydrolase
MRKFVLFALLGIQFAFPENVYSQITIVTYNIRFANKHDSLNDWFHRSSGLCNQIENYDADFIGLQEALFFQIKSVEKSLGSKYKYIGVGRDFGDTIGEHCPLFYRSDIYQKLDSNAKSTFWLSETENIPSKSWDAALPRIATGGMFRNKQTNKLVYVLNTHFDHVGNVARINSMYLIHKKIKPYLDSGIAVILLGDFNLPPQSEPIEWISTKLNNSRNLTYAQLIKEYKKHTFNGFKETPNGPIIDYVFTSNKLRTFFYEVDQRQRGKDLFYSDHFPVIVKLMID